MLIIDRLNQNTYQSLSMLDRDFGKKIEMIFNYAPTQNLWHMALQYEGFVVKGLTVVNDLNMLHQYRHIIPFGLFVATKDGFDPYFIDDFANGRAVIGLLNNAERNAISEVLGEV